MRKFKFRAYNKAFGDSIMHFFDLYNIETFLESVYESKPNDNWEIMQFTGLLDKNGKDIYEGDIVKIANYKTTWKHAEPIFDWRVFQIKWNQWLWACENNACYFPLSRYNPSTLEEYDIEVIGNIYETPEILNK